MGRKRRSSSIDVDENNEETIGGEDQSAENEEQETIDRDILPQSTAEEAVSSHENIDNTTGTLTSTSALKNVNLTTKSDGRYHNKQRCLIMCSRGVTARYRHLLEDMRTLIPHHKKDSKLDAGNSKGGAGQAINDIAEMKSCNSFIFLECRKRGQDAYLHLGFTPDGPSAKFHLTNVHTMDELRLTGNCMKGSRPILSFDDTFDKLPHLKLLRILFTDIFGTPRGHPKSKPFVDRVMGFYYADNKIWVRNYQIQDEQASNAKEASELKNQDGLHTSLVEIGPRFVLSPIRISVGSFWGQTLYQNEEYVSPNELRAERMRGKGNEYKKRKKSQQERKERKDNLVLPEDPLASVFR